MELNPVRAGMVETASEWKWSSAAAHCGVAAPAIWLDLQLWSKRWTAEAWVEYLSAGESAAEVAALRQFTHTGRPLGSAAFVADLEQSTFRLLAPRKKGRRLKPGPDSDQPKIAFVA